MIGLLGGTFNPPHMGHLILAEQARIIFGLEKVLFVPTKIPPHKNHSSIISFHFRKKMLHHAISDNPFFEISDIEPDRSDYSSDTEDRGGFTVDLLEKYVSVHPRPALIIGMDSLFEFITWKNPYRIVELAEVLAGSRPGYTPDDVPEDLLEKIRVFCFPDVRISSSDLRNRFAGGSDCRYLIPDTVREYILREGLYATGNRN